MKKITDESLIEELNQSRHLQNNILPKIEKVEDPGALRTFGRSAFNAIPSAIGNVMIKLGASTPEIVQEALYGKGDEGLKRKKLHEQGEMAHPLASLAGDVLGFGPLGASTSMGLRSIPAVSRAVKAASPSILKRTGVHALEGGAIGSLYSPPGSEGEGFGYGAAIGGLLGGPGVSLARNLSNIRQQGKNIANIEELGLERENAQNRYVNQQSIIDELKKQYKMESTGLQTSEDITRQINKNKDRIEELQPEANRAFEPTENLLTEPPISEQVSHLDKEMNNILRQKTNYLTSEKPKGVEFAEELNNTVTNAKKYIQKNYYNPVTDYTKKSHISFPRTKDVEAIDKQIENFFGNKLTKENAGFEKLKKEYLKQSHVGNDLVPAHEYLQNWKTIKQAAAKARRLGFAEGGDNQAHWQNEAERLQEIADKQLAVLKNHLPESYFNKLTQGDALWKEHITPFYGNKIYEQSRPVKNKGKIDVSDIMHEVRGNEPSQAKVRETILSNPNLSRLALGHKYAEKPLELLQASPYEQQFINRLPSLVGHIERYKKAQFNKKVAEIHQKGQERRFEELEELHKHAKVEQKQRHEAQKEINKIEMDVKNLQSKKERLEKELEMGKINKKEFEHLDKQYNDAIKNKKSVLSKLTKAGIYSAAALGITGAIKQLLSK